MEENVKDIKSQLKMYGGLIITNRQVGKTEALLELLHEEKDSFLITFNCDQRENLKRRYKKKYNDRREDFIYAQHSHFKQSIKNAYIDEYFFHNTWHKKFRGAVSTMSFPIRIKKYPCEVDEDAVKTFLTDDQFREEISLEFPITKEEK